MKTLEIMRESKLLAISVFVTTMILASCQSGSSQISIDGVNAELSPAIMGEAMVTINIRNQGGSDVLKEVKTDIPGAKASFHVMQGERMVNMNTIEVPAKSNLELKMSGSHIMIQDMPMTVTVGSKFNVTLVFEKSGVKELPIPLQGASEMPMGHEHHM